jgi:hypothetical protein
VGQNVELNHFSSAQDRRSCASIAATVPCVCQKCLANRIGAADLGQSGWTLPGVPELDLYSAGRTWKLNRTFAEPPLMPSAAH